MSNFVPKTTLPPAMIYRPGQRLTLSPAIHQYRIGYQLRSGVVGYRFHAAKPEEHVDILCYAHARWVEPRDPVSTWTIEVWGGFARGWVLIVRDGMRLAGVAA